MIGLPTFFIWGGIFVLQLITHIPLLSIDLALNELKFLVYLNRIVSFNLFSTKPLIGYGFSETQPLNQNFARLDYKSSNFFENLGGLSLFTIALPVILLAVKILLSPTKLCKCSARMHETFSLVFIFNICARLFLLTLIELLIATFIGLKLSSDLKGKTTTLDTIAIVAPYLCLLELGLFMIYVFHYTGLKNADMAN